MNLPTDDKPLDEYLSGGSEVSRRYRSLRKEEPPAELDRAVLSQARKVAVFPRRKAARWAVPTAAAATLVLSFFLLRGLGPDIVTERAAAPVTMQLKAERPESLDEKEKRKTDLAEAEKLANLSAVRVETRATKRMRDTTAAVVASALPTVPPPVQAAEPAMGQSAPSPEETKSQPAAAVAFEFQRAKMSRTESLASYDKAAAAPAPALRSPEAWLEDIRKLRASGQQAEADAQLKRFLVEHPDYFEKNPAVVRP